MYKRQEYGYVYFEANASQAMAELLKERKNFDLIMERRPNAVSYTHLNGASSIFTIEVKGGQEEAHRFIDSLEIFSLLANVADVKSLVIHPALSLIHI